MGRLISNYKKWKIGRFCRQRGSHAYEEDQGILCPFTGNTYHYCIDCGERRTTPGGN